LIVDGLRPRRAAIDRSYRPAARPSAVSFRSAKDRHRSCRSRPRRGRMPPASRTPASPLHPSLGLYEHDLIRPRGDRHLDLTNAT